MPISTRAVLDNAALMAEVAQDIAVAGIGLRGAAASKRMNMAKREAIARRAEERWESITRAAWTTRDKAHGEDRHDQEMVERCRDHDAASDARCADAPNLAREDAVRGADA
jgi:hypothetical protein